MGKAVLSRKVWDFTKANGLLKGRAEEKWKRRGIVFFTEERYNIT